ncbi:zinc-ribbon domain-containing protein [Roseomonas sp. SSH11]|uniref:Zinc-ribbon domain-containing protein n=1 Tax=Pararoseomonas baculiformis TaxID=2820812 RepID=A0ABS4AIJ5_9PROT|nr:zinc-ribbon domain-containing protein [Pararoseomonas baculiformis]MBP0446348.1 zinc-ribbon domain-containing protein [Pararoseomonas baculiformis]
MRVACPECAAEYQLPPALASRLGEGRTVRCARCGTAWAPGAVAALPAGPGAAVPPEGPGAAAPPAAPGPARPHAGPAPAATPEEPMLEVPPRPARSFDAAEPPPRARWPELDPPPPASPPSRGAGLGWALSLLLLAGVAAAAWHWRVELVEVWPPAARVFLALGVAG